MFLGVFLRSSGATGGVFVLFDTEIRRAKVKSKPYRLTDGRGLYLLVTRVGGKLWRWKYRFKDAE